MKNVEVKISAEGLRKLLAGQEVEFEWVDDDSRLLLSLEEDVQIDVELQSKMIAALDEVVPDPEEEDDE